MNAILLFLALVFNGNSTCLAQGEHTRSIDGQAYRVDTFQCFWKGSEATPSHTFEVWWPLCPGYVEQPILLKEDHLLKGWTMNEFGEFYPATLNVDLMEVHRPQCRR
jgi:hypothetical protein